MAKRKEDRNNNGNIHPKRIFKTPKDLFNAFQEYKANVEIKAEKWLKVQYVGKDGQRVTDKQMPPLTYEGFKIFCYDNYGDITNYFNNRDGYYDDFHNICTRIKDEIRDNQITGGMLGFYNPSITQRLNNLKEQNDITSGDKSLEPLSYQIYKPTDD